MAIINGKLTTIGGCEDRSGTETKTNVILTLESGVLTSKRSWKEVLPPLPASRTRPAAVATDSLLVVAGGWEEQGVEMLNLKTRQWTSVQGLPKPGYYPQMVLCEGMLYISLDDCVLSCSLEKLVKSSSADVANVWTGLPPTGQHSVALVTLGEHLLALGGSDELSTEPKADILCYNREIKDWSFTGQMPSPQFRVLALVLEGRGQVIVLGGKNGSKDTYIGLSELDSYVIIS
jgi:hypothetical protein